MYSHRRGLSAYRTLYQLRPSVVIAIPGPDKHDQVRRAYIHLTRLRNRNSLLLHSLQQRVWVATHLIEFVDAARPLIRKHQGSSFQAYIPGRSLFAESDLLFVDRVSEYTTRHI